MEFKDIEIFKELNGKEIMKVRKIVEEKSYSTGDVIFNENEPGDRICVITSGAVEVKKNIVGENNTEQKITLARLTPFEIFGELSIFENVPRSASVEAIANTEVMVITKDDFEALLDSEPELGVKLLRAIIKKTAKRLFAADITIRDLARKVFHI
jgi:CRP-like cAMP-binding protein